MSSQAAGTGGTVPILDARHEYKCRLGEAWAIMLDVAGHSLAALGHYCRKRDRPTHDEER